MKLDLKIFQIFILLILIYGGGYYFGNLGKFIFPINYTHFVIGLISLIFLFSTKFSLFSALLLPFGISLIYLMFPESFHEYYETTCGIISLVFTLILLLNNFKNKKNSFYIYFSIFIIFSFLAIGFRGITGSYWDTNYYKIIYGIKFILILLILQKNKESEKLDVGIKRFIIVLGMYYFVELMRFQY